MHHSDMDTPAPERKTVHGLMEAIRLERARRRWSQQDVATQIGTSPDHISGIETGRVDPRFSTVVRIADALGMTITLTDNAA